MEQPVSRENLFPMAEREGIDAMIVETQKGRTVLACFPEAQAVYLIGDFNRWCTGMTPMQRRPEDGLWEAELPEGAREKKVAFFVFEAGHVGGRLYRHDVSVARAVESTRMEGTFGDRFTMPMGDRAVDGSERADSIAN